MTSADLDVVEATLDTRFCEAFRRFMTRHGPTFSPDILEALVNRGWEHPDLQQVFGAQELVEATRGYRSAGMPGDVIGFASDCMGNLFGFRRSDERQEDAPVVFFDHHELTVSEVATSFDELLDWYLVHLG